MACIEDRNSLARKSCAASGSLMTASHQCSAKFKKKRCRYFVLTPFRKPSATRQIFVRRYFRKVLQCPPSAVASKDRLSHAVKMGSARAPRGTHQVDSLAKPFGESPG